MSTAQPSTAKKYHLLDIPAELRLEIYEHYFKDFDLLANSQPLSDKRDDAGLKAPLLHVCALIKKEALPVYEKHIQACQKSAEDQFEAFRAHIAASRKPFDPTNPKQSLLDAFIALDKVEEQRAVLRERGQVYEGELRRIALAEAAAVSLPCDEVHSEV